MDPRALIGPTFLVFMLIVATVGSLFLLEPVELEELQPEDYYSMSATELKAKLSEQMSSRMNRQLIYYAIIALLICIVPMGNTTRLTRGAILVGIGFIGKFVSGDQAGSVSSLTKLCVLGGMLLVVLFVTRVYGKAVNNGKRPATERWAPRSRNPRVPDDPETLAKLDRLRVTASEPPPMLS